MTDVLSPLPLLEGLVLESKTSEPAADGFHHRHVAGADRLVSIARAFVGLEYHLEMITCEDRRADLRAMRLVYTFNRYIGEPDRHVLIVDLPPDIPGAVAPSISAVFAGADWFEREIFDMYGVKFSQHPNLKRLLLPEDADFHALLKDFGQMEAAES